MTPTVPEWSAVAAKIGALLASIVPEGTPILQGPVNRVAQPAASHVMFSYLFERRLRTNVSTYTRPDPVPPPPGPIEGTRDIEQGTEIHVQLDFYARTGDMQTVAKWAAAVSTLWRDEYACDALAPEAAPLYIDDARGAPLAFGEQQYVGRWISTAVLQVNPVTSVPQEFAAEAEVSLVLANALEIEPL
jgi:hypothetical protein